MKIKKWQEAHLNWTVTIGLFLCLVVVSFGGWAILISYIMLFAISLGYLNSKNRSLGWYFLWCWVIPGAAYAGLGGSVVPTTPVVAAFLLLPLKNKRVIEKKEALPNPEPKPDNTNELSNLSIENETDKPPPD